jgi:hypothetical protein
MPIFPVPPVGPEDGGHVSEVVRELVGNRNYTRKGRFGGDRIPRRDVVDRPSLWSRIRARFRR